MNEQQFIEFFKSLMDESVEDLDMDTEFRYLDEWSSLAGVAFLAEAKTHFDKVISVSDFKNAETLQDLYKLVNKN